MNWSIFPPDSYKICTTLQWWWFRAWSAPETRWLCHTISELTFNPLVLVKKAPSLWPLETSSLVARSLKTFCPREPFFHCYPDLCPFFFDSCSPLIFHKYNLKGKEDGVFWNLEKPNITLCTLTLMALGQTVHKCIPKHWVFCSAGKKTNNRHNWEMRVWK